MSSGWLSQSIMVSLFDMTVVSCCCFYREHLLCQAYPPKVNLLPFLWEAADWWIKTISMFIFPFQDVFKATLTLFLFFFWSTLLNETRLVYRDASSGSINRHADGAFITSRGSSSTSSTFVTMRAALGGDIIFRKLIWFMHSFLFFFFFSFGFVRLIYSGESVYQTSGGWKAPGVWFSPKQKNLSLRRLLRFSASWSSSPPLRRSLQGRP